MKNLLLLLLILLATKPTTAQNAVIGKWKTIDDETGKERSIIEIYEKGSLLYGKVIKTFPLQGEEADPVCSKCDKNDPRYNQKIVGMTILQNMKKVSDSYSGGEILDPKNGKIYSCKIWLEDNVLMVRGYWGPFFRTQTWVKVQ
jgi:uncharacterized protein (DUF2147 family)